MPAALERKLKKEASEKGLSKKRKDAYVYGTLRKTGWKPSREMNNPSKLQRFHEISKRLDSLVQFAYDGEDETENKKSLLGSAAKTGGLVGTGVAGTLGHQAVMRSGGYGAALNRLKNTTMGKAAVAGGANVARGIGTQVSYALSKLKTLLPAVKGLESKNRLMEFSGNPTRQQIKEGAKAPGFASERILEPWGPVPKSKIIQEKFPPGRTPGYKIPITGSPGDILRLPFPEMMKRLGRRNILQQQWSGLSAKLDDLLEFKSKDWKEKGKEKVEEAKEKWRSKFQKKGRKSHGGGT